MGSLSLECLNPICHFFWKNLPWDLVCIALPWCLSFIMYVVSQLSSTFCVRFAANSRDLPYREVYYYHSFVLGAPGNCSEGDH